MQSLDGDSAVPGAAIDAAAVSLSGQCLRARAVAAGRGCEAPTDCQQVSGQNHDAHASVRA